MSHEHRQHPERYYDDEGEAYEPHDLSRRALEAMAAPAIARARRSAEAWEEYLRRVNEDWPL